MKMRKGRGKGVRMREVIEEVGLDGVGYLLGMGRGDREMDFELDLAVWTCKEKGVYYGE